eukprot:gnl/TRDRNA2_/TRDRNA2_176606_c0_seq4.p1 gnl/TRDRNA2_/TRDRNA2_176606_c0~~gnl/TRDRNA2_/TRDRNA2_176606_c0_seq4.p1  ORF type:complete len:490 (+),score=78.90 gnl/TRDRNA2_/TRDRNA2_176606_c0_seq4:64-1533(+)
MFSDSDAEKRWDRRARTPEPPCSGPRLAVELQILWTVQQMAQQQQLMAAAIFQILHMFHATPPPRTDANSATQVAALVAATTIEEQRARSDQPQAQPKKKHRRGVRLRRSRCGIADSAGKGDMELEVRQDPDQLSDNGPPRALGHASLPYSNLEKTRPSDNMLSDNMQSRSHTQYDTDIAFKSGFHEGSHDEMQGALEHTHQKNLLKSKLGDAADGKLADATGSMGLARLSVSTCAPTTASAESRRASLMSVGSADSEGLTVNNEENESSITPHNVHFVTETEDSPADQQPSHVDSILEPGKVIVGQNRLSRTVQAMLNSPSHLAAANDSAKACSTTLNVDFSDVNAKGSYGCTVLHWAAASNNVAVCKAILAHEGFTEVDAKDTTRGWTALHWAAAGGHLAACQAILDCARFTGINAHATLGDWTALHLAASAGYSGVCRAILCHGDFMDIDKQNIDGDTAMQLAVKHGHGEVIEVIDGYNQLVALLL